VGLAIFGVRLSQACAQLTHAWVKFSRVAQRCFLTAPSVCRRPNCPLTRRAKQRIGRIVRESDCHSQRLDPPLRGRTEAVWMWSDCPTPVGSDCLNMKMFVGRIVTVSDGAGRSVTVSKWGVAQSSRHLQKV
jgi:hypothetical protein